MNIAPVDDQEMDREHLEPLPITSYKDDKSEIKTAGRRFRSLNYEV